MPLGSIGVGHSSLASLKFLCDRQIAEPDKNTPPRGHSARLWSYRSFASVRMMFVCLGCPAVAVRAAPLPNGSMGPLPALRSNFMGGDTSVSSHKESVMPYSRTVAKAFPSRSGARPAPKLGDGPSGKEESRGAGSFTSIPVIDLSELRNGEEDRKRIVHDLRDICHTVGFFYVVNHGIPDMICSSALSAANEFFSLPAEEKMCMHHTRSHAFRGYIRLAAENTGGLPDLREQVEFGVESESLVDERHRTAAGIFPVYKRLIGPNQWPADEQVPGFRRNMEDLMDAMHALSITLIEALTEGLGVPADSLAHTIGDNPNMQMKIARYPPADRDSEGAGSSYGVGPHTDSGYLSILLQDNVGGLQVQNGAGEWINAPPIQGALIVNLGEMLQLASGGYYLATVHRVLPPPCGGKSRLSVPYFFNPKLDAEVFPLDLPEDLGWQRPSPKALDHSDTHGGRNRLLSRYGDNAFKSLARSHPEVLEIHHPDLKIGENGMVCSV